MPCKHTETNGIKILKEILRYESEGAFKKKGGKEYINL